MEDVMTDENGKEVRSLTKKVIEPRPHAEDLTRVQVGPDPLVDYLYVDPVVLFQLERMVPQLAEMTKSGAKKSHIYEATKVFPKYTRDIAEAALPFWPQHGYVLRRRGAHTAVLPVLEDGGAEVIPFPETTQVGSVQPMSPQQFGETVAAWSDIPGAVQVAGPPAPVAHPSQAGFVPVPQEWADEDDL